MKEGYVFRYSAANAHDDLPAEGAFTMCGFWLVEAYALLGRTEEARALYERLLTTANDVGLFSEEFDIVRGMAIGNTPQAFSHVGAINAARRLSEGNQAQ